MVTRLTCKRLRAIEEALIFRLAGVIEGSEDAIAREDYEAALELVNDQTARRSGKR
jgi:citrate lyase beta subunit